MDRTRVILILSVVCVLLPVRADAQNQDETAQLQAALDAQQALIQKLLERIESLEAGQTAVLDKIHAVEESIPDESAMRAEREMLVEEIRQEYFDLQERIDLMPTFSGYYDFEYWNDNREDSPGEFRQHRLSLHLTKEWDKWRLFSEIEFEYGTKFEGDGGEALEEARGEVKLEQAWAEYVHSDKFILRGGLILTPGYWNVNHYPNVVLSTRRPLMCHKIIRASFVGVMGYGSKYWDDFGLTYYGYVGNGQSAYFTKHDDNEGKAVGGKVTFHVPTKGKLDALDLSLNMYQESPSHQDRLFAWGLEAQARKGPWEVLSEFASRDAEEDGAGFYFQPSYRFNEKWATFYRYDLLTIEHEGETQEHSLGVNHRPIPNISLKLEYFYSIQSDEEDYSGVAASIAVAF